MGELRKVNPGDRLQIPARAYNAFVDLANRAGRPAASGLSHLETGPLPHVVAAIRNSTGSALAPHDIVAIDGIVVEVEDAPLAERLVPTLKAIVPDAEHVGALAIVLDAIPAGRIGHACVGGIALAKVQMVAEGHRLADLWPEELHKLRSGTNGCVALLWVQPPDERAETGVAWCVVRLAGQGQYHWSGKIVTEGPNEEEDFTDERYWIERCYESNTTPTAALTLEAHPTSDPEAGVVMATNYAESLAHTHKLQPGQYVHVFETVDRTTSPPTIRYFFTLMPVMLAVWLGGTFSTVGSRACAGACEYDPQRGVVPLATYNDGDGTVHRAMEFRGLARFQGKLYGVGAFNINGNSYTVVRRDDDTGLWSGVTDHNLSVGNAITVSADGNTLYVGGQSSANNRAVWAFDGTTWTPMAFALSVTVLRLTEIDGTLYAGCYGPVTATAGGIAYWTGSAWAALAGGVKWGGGTGDVAVYAIAEHAGEIHIGGKFDWPGSCKWVAVLRDGVWTPVGLADETSDFGSPANQLLSHGGKLYGLAGWRPPPSGITSTLRKPLGVWNDAEETWENAGAEIKDFWGGTVGNSSAVGLDMCSAGDYLLIVGRFYGIDRTVDGETLRIPCVNAVWYNPEDDAYEDFEGGVGLYPISGYNVSGSYVQVNGVAAYTVPDKRGERYLLGGIIDACGGVYSKTLGQGSTTGGLRAQGGLHGIGNGTWLGGAYVWLAGPGGTWIAGNFAFAWNRFIAPEDADTVAELVRGSVILWDGTYFIQIGAAPAGGMIRALAMRDGVPVIWGVGGEPYYWSADDPQDDDTKYVDGTWELLSEQEDAEGFAWAAVEFGGEVWFVGQWFRQGSQYAYVARTVGLTDWELVDGNIGAVTQSNDIKALGEHLVIGLDTTAAAVRQWNAATEQFDAVGTLTGTCLKIALRMEDGELAIYAAGGLQLGAVAGEFWRWTATDGWERLAEGTAGLNALFGMVLNDDGKHYVHGDFGTLDNGRFPSVARYDDVGRFSAATFGGSNGIVVGMSG